MKHINSFEIFEGSTYNTTKQKYSLMKHLIGFNESVTQKDIQSFLIDFGTFISLNLVKIQSEAKDENCKIQLQLMQKRLREPVINGYTFFDVIDTTKVKSSLLFNSNFINGVLNQVRSFLIWIKTNIKKYVKDGNYKSSWVDRINGLEDKYLQIIK